MNDYIWHAIAAALIFVLVVSFLILLRSLKNKVSELTIELENLNHLDELTGISNRRYFDEVYYGELKRANRNKSPIAVIMIDVDFFKDYNVIYDYQQGDSCLKEVASVLTHRLKRETDVICRYGGEAFVVLLPDTSSEAALHISELLRTDVEKLKIPHKGSTVSDYVTISLGVASVIPDENNDAVQSADEALHCAKINRNAVCLYDETHQKWMKSNLNQN